MKICIQWKSETKISSEFVSDLWPRGQYFESQCLTLSTGSGIR